jgi:Putative auto-transporter adhesin, head GIN domain
MRLAPLLFAAVLTAVLTTAPAVAAAETVVPVAKFTGVELHGGGRINIHQGPVQHVTLVEGDPAVVGFEVNGRGRLIVSSCKGFCWGSHRLEVDIETPDLNAAEIHGGGRILAKGPFPAQASVSAAIHGGGDIDLRDVPAQSASAAIHGGGKIFVAAQNGLDAEIFGGGEIRYAGHPSVSSSIHGGGSVSSIQ